MYFKIVELYQKIKKMSRELQITYSLIIIYNQLNKNSMFYFLKHWENGQKI